MCISRPENTAYADAVMMNFRGKERVISVTTFVNLCLYRSWLAIQVET